MHVWDGSRSGSGGLLWSVQSGSSTGSSILCLSASSDGSKLAVGTSDGGLVLYDVSAPAPSPLPDPPGAPPVLVQLINPSEGSTSSAAAAAAVSVSLSADGSVVVAAVGRLVKVWIRYGFQWYLRYELSGHAGAVTSVGVSGDGTTAFSGACDAAVRVWDLTHGTEVGPAMLLGGPSRCATLVANSADGRGVATAADGDNLIRFWTVWRTEGRRR